MPAMDDYGRLELTKINYAQKLPEKKNNNKKDI